MKSNRNHTYFITPDEAEVAFYSAFEMLDLALMEAVLSDHDGCCVHPGGVLVLGKDDILGSWRQIFQHMMPFTLQHEILTRTTTENRAIHVVAEMITLTNEPERPTSIVIATNVYCRQENGWRLFHHHASQPSSWEMLQKLTVHTPPRSLQ